LLFGGVAIKEVSNYEKIYLLDTDTTGEDHAAGKICHTSTYLSENFSPNRLTTSTFVNQKGHFQPADASLRRERSILPWTQFSHLPKITSVAVNITLKKHDFPSKLSKIGQKKSKRWKKKFLRTCEFILMGRRSLEA
jgi:hypothetical protein